MKICILIPYYGRWPNYFGLYLQSLANNPWLDVIFITDLELPVNAPPNARYEFLAKKDLIGLIKKKLDVNQELSNNYKLCDFKPAYGFLFEELLQKQEYDFWGWGDIDLIYGDLKKFYPLERFKNYDIISGREKWISGSLMFLRNSRLLKELFFNNPHYRKVFERNHYEGFDECNRQFKELKGGAKISDTDHGNSMTYLAFTTDKPIRHSFQNLIRESIVNSKYVSFENGSITYDQKEYALFHFVLVKENYWFKFPEWTKIPDSYWITLSGFKRYPFKSNQIKPDLILKKILFFHLQLKKYARRVVRKIIS